MSDAHGGGVRRSSDIPPEPVFLASQLASMCDVDLKTIHNWCGRSADVESNAGLESFRTEGGHLRFRHASVLRFLRRWGYPIPDALLADRPHVLLVEGDGDRRRELIDMLSLRRPGDEYGVPEGTDTTGLWCTPRFYLHVWADPYAALVALGERVGAGAPPDIVVLPTSLDGIDERQWIHAARTMLGAEAFRCVLVSPDDRVASVAREPGVVSVVSRRHTRDLTAVLQQQTSLLISGQPRPRGRRARKRRLPIAPREPIFVASQVATIWGVDLKTVHNWVDRGDIEAFRTPGRHLRFRRRALLHLLRRYDKPVPAGVAPERPQVMLVTAPGSPLGEIAERLSANFDVMVEHDAVRALAEVGRRCAGASLLDAVVVEFPRSGIHDARWCASVREHPDTRYTLVFAVGAEEGMQEPLREAGVAATMPAAHPEVLVSLLSRALGAAP
jgi:excisionase family DNA binding protein